MEKQKYIIGAGISGLLLAYFYRDAKVICREENVGGQLKAQFQMGPRFIRKTESFVKLLDTLAISHTTKTIKVGYFDGVVISNNPNDSFKSEYSFKTRGTREVSKNALNDGLNEMEVIEFDMMLLIRKLNDIAKDRMINANVVKIDTRAHTILLDNGEELMYDKLFSTIHYKEFCSLAKLECNFEFSDIYFYLSKKLLLRLNHDYSFIYIADSSPFTRVSIIEQGYCYESPRQLTPGELERYGIIDSLELKNSKLRGKYEIEDVNDVIQVGRWAQLDGDVRMHNSVEKIEEILNG